MPTRNQAHHIPNHDSGLGWPLKDWGDQIALASDLAVLPENQSALIATVSQLIAEKRYAQQLGVASRARVQNRNWDTILDSLLADYATLVGSRMPVYLSMQTAA